MSLQRHVQPYFLKNKSTQLAAAGLFLAKHRLCSGVKYWRNVLINLHCCQMKKSDKYITVQDWTERGINCSPVKQMKHLGLCWQIHSALYSVVLLHLPFCAPFVLLHHHRIHLNSKTKIWQCLIPAWEFKILQHKECISHQVFDLLNEILYLEETN